MTVSRDFPSCCTGSILVGFGKTATGDHVSQSASAMMTERSLVRDLIGHMRRAAQRGEAFITCTINSDQQLANSVLRKLGWRPSKWMTKRNHRNTQVRVWTWAVEDMAGLQQGYTQPTEDEILLLMGLDKFVVS